MAASSTKSSATSLRLVSGTGASYAGAGGRRPVRPSRDGGARLGGGDRGGAAGASPRPLERGADEVAEERRRPRRAALELRVELARHEPRVVGQLDDFDQATFLVRARHHQ